MNNHGVAVAYLALFVALGGSSYAAMKLPGNSVGATQIKKGAVRSSEVKDRSLQSSDFALGHLPAGSTGPAGPPGARGPAGPAALSLAFDRPVQTTNPGTPVFTRLATVGPWEISTRCYLAGGTFLALTVRGPGQYRLSGINVQGEPDGNVQQVTGGAPLSTTARTVLLSGGYQYTPGHLQRFAYTIELNNGTQAATVSLNAVADTNTPKHCHGSGTAVLAG